MDHRLVAGLGAERQQRPTWCSAGGVEASGVECRIYGNRQ